MTSPAMPRGEATARLPMPADCSIRSVAGIAERAREQLADGNPTVLDCAQVVTADLAFVQFVVSARRSFAARRLPLTVEGATPAVLAAFARAAIPPPENATQSSGK